MSTDEICSFFEVVSYTSDSLGGENATSEIGRHWAKLCQELREPEPIFLEVVAATVEVLGESSEIGRHWAKIYRELQVGVVASTVEVLGRSSEIGLHWANVYQELKRRTGNLTSQWLAKNGKATRQMLIEHLSHKLPTSRRVSVVEDHVQTFLCRLVEKDTLASHLAEGKTIQPSVLRIWAYQSACTEMRGWGVDASLRKSRGAKTNRDQLAEAGKRPQVVIHSCESVVERRYEVENGEVITDLHDPHARSVEDDLIASESYDRALTLVSKKIGVGAGPRYRALLENLLDGGKRAELAHEAGVSPARMAAMLARIRDVLRDESVLSD